MVNVNLESLVVGREEFDRIVDRKFYELLDAETLIVSPRTLEQFFQDYEDLYYQIPIEGETASHRYLVNLSSRMIPLDQDQSDIQPLLDEIANLRAQNLKIQQELVILTTKVAQNAV